MAEIHQRLGRPERAFECRSRAWLTDVESGETLAEMEALGLAGGLHGELVATLEKGAVEAGDPNLQAQLWAMTARLLEDPLGRAGDAIEAWRSALSARPDDRDAFLALERLLSAGARSQRAGRRPREAPRDHAPTRASARRSRSASRCSTKTRSSSASRRFAPGRWCWRSIPADGDALESLAPPPAASGAYRELTDVYARKLELSDRPEERRLLFAQSAPHLRGEPDRTRAGGRASCASCWRRRRATTRRWSPWIGYSRMKSATRTWSTCSISGRDSRSRRRTATSSPSARRASPRPICPTSRPRSAVTRASWRRRPTTPARARRCCTIARGDDYRVPAIEALEPILRTARPGIRSSSCSSCAWRSRTRSSTGWRSWARSRASTSWNGVTSTARSRPGRAR